MVGVGEMLASAVVRAAMSQLLSLVRASIRGPVRRVQTFKEDLQDMVDTLKFVEAGISDAEKRSVHDNVTRVWLKQLKKAAYEIYDMFDEFQHGSSPDRLRAPSVPYTIFLGTDMAKRMKNMKKTLKKISEGRRNYGTEGDLCESDRGKKNDKLETTSRLGSDMIVGRRIEKESVVNILLSSNDTSCTVIHGLGGVGKTELAKLVFNDERIRQAFPQRAWVYLHKSSSINDIGNAIIGEVEGGVSRFDNKQAINKHLEKVIIGRCLIVLDNLWDSDQLTGLQDILGRNVSILVTSRRAIPLHTTKTISFHLETLSDKSSFELVKQVAFSHFIGGDGLPESAMKELVTKCKGVPLALKTVASSLLKHGGDGKELLGIIKARFQPKSEYGSLDIEETVLESLKLTYHLMNDTLKLCFAYSAIFPKGSQIDWKDLYHQWTALDLIQGSDEIDKKWSAEANVRQLLDMSFLQDAGPSSVTRRSTGVPAKLKMHDLVHDLAMLVADDVLVVISQENSASASKIPRLVALPAWFGDLNSLKKLTIEGCSSLKSLPQLSMLEHLLLKYNGELERWCETEVNRTTFAKIKRQVFWLEGTCGSNSYMLPARSLDILWAHDDRYWRLISTPVSRFAVSMQLLEVWWLVIEGSIPVEALSTNTIYDVYLVYKLAEEHDGLRWGESYVNVNGLRTDGTIVSFVDEDAVRVDGVAYPVSRSEGWMELRLGTFCNRFGDGDIRVGVTEKNDTYAKKGLIIEGMEIRQST